MCSVIDTNVNNQNFDFGDVEEDDMFFDTSCIPSDALYAEINYHEDQVSSNNEPFYDCYSELPEDTTSPIPLKHSFPILFFSIIFPLATLLCALWFDYRKTLWAMSPLITCVSYKWCIINLMNYLVQTETVQSGPLKKWDSFAYPSHLLILSCVMLKQQFVSMMTDGTPECYTFRVQNKSVVPTLKLI